MSSLASLLTAIENGEPVDHAALSTLPEDQRQEAIARLLESAAGRRWLRSIPDLSADDADRLLTSESDFRQHRRDRSLGAVIERATRAAIEEHAFAIAAGPAASTLWNRLGEEPERRVDIARLIVAGDDLRAAEATLHLLVLDPLDPFTLGEPARVSIAARALGSSSADVRGLAAEFLADHAPDELRDMFEQLILDDSEQVRGIAWASALRHLRQPAVERATALLADESVPIPTRRSALNAIGTALPTSQVADILAWFVVHPDHQLAADAATLLHDLHRNPITAEAARESPHADVREIAERLLDPLRGSPAAGGSRPGDPTRSSTDIYADMIRQLEKRAGDQMGDDERSS